MSNSFKWRSISEYPKDGTVVDLWLIGDGWSDRLAECEWVGGEWFHADEPWRNALMNGGDIKITHFICIEPPRER